MRDPKEFFEAFEDAPSSARWAFATGLALVGSFWLTQAEWLKHVIGADFTTARYGVVLAPLSTFWKYVNVRTKGKALAKEKLAALEAAAINPRRWSLDELRVQMRKPLYCQDGSGQFLAEIGFYSPVPFPPNSKIKNLLVEARSNGVVLGQYRYPGSSIILVGSNVRIGKALVPIKDDAFHARMHAEAASHSGNWEVQIDVRVSCELVVPELSDSGPHDFHAEAQFCGVRFAFDHAELKGVLPKDLT